MTDDQLLRQLSSLAESVARQETTIAAAIAQQSQDLGKQISLFVSSLGDHRRTHAEDLQRVKQLMAAMVLTHKEQGRELLRRMELYGDAQRRELLQLRGATNELVRREPSRTIVTDVVKSETLTIESESGSRDGEEISVVFFRLPFTKKVHPIPNEWLRKIGIALASSSVGAGVIHLLHQWHVLK